MWATVRGSFASLKSISVTTASVITRVTCTPFVNDYAPRPAGRSHGADYHSHGADYHSQVAGDDHSGADDDDDEDSRDVSCPGRDSVSGAQSASARSVGYESHIVAGSHTLPLPADPVSMTGSSTARGAPLAGITSSGISRIGAARLELSATATEEPDGRATEPCGRAIEPAQFAGNTDGSSARGRASNAVSDAGQSSSPARAGGVGGLVTQQQSQRGAYSESSVLGRLPPRAPGSTASRNGPLLRLRAEQLALPATNQGQQHRPAQPQQALEQLLEEQQATSATSQRSAQGSGHGFGGAAVDPASSSPQVSGSAGDLGTGGLSGGARSGGSCASPLEAQQLQQPVPTPVPASVPTPAGRSSFDSQASRWRREREPLASPLARRATFDTPAFVHAAHSSAPQRLAQGVGGDRATFGTLGDMRASIAGGPPSRSSLGARALAVHLHCS